MPCWIGRPNGNGVLGRADQRPEVEQLEQRLQVQLVLVHRLQAAQQRRKGLGDAIRGLDVHRQTAHADRALQRAIGDIQEGQSAGQDRQHRPRGACQVPPDDQCPHLDVVALEELGETLDEEIADA